MVPEWINHFETITDVAAQVAYLVSHQLPEDHFAMELARFEAVTKTDVDWLAKHFLAPRWMTVLVVGDRSRIEKSLRDFPFGKTIRLLDTAGKPVRQAPDAARLAPVERRRETIDAVNPPDLHLTKLSVRYSVLRSRDSVEGNLDESLGNAAT